MISIKNKAAINKMATAGSLLSEIFENLIQVVEEGCSTLEINAFIAGQLKEKKMVSAMLGYHGYKYVSCISLNDEVVHGIPSTHKILKKGDLVKVDVCASWQGYCADMARAFFIGKPSATVRKLIDVAQKALEKGIEKALPGNRLGDISAAIQSEVELNGFGVVRDFAGHGIGKNMHEEPEVLNYGVPGKGVVLQAGMALALEPMITLGDYKVYVVDDGWTVKTVDKSLATHVEDTVVITTAGPKVLTRKV